MQWIKLACQYIGKLSKVVYVCFVSSGSRSGRDEPKAGSR